jgi:hypothetical protein
LAAILPLERSCVRQPELRRHLPELRLGAAGVDLPRVHVQPRRQRAGRNGQAMTAAPRRGARCFKSWHGRWMVSGAAVTAAPRASLCSALPATPSLLASRESRELVDRRLTNKSRCRCRGAPPRTDRVPAANSSPRSSSRRREDSGQGGNDRRIETSRPGRARAASARSQRQHAQAGAAGLAATVAATDTASASRQRVPDA